jgi:hypothetical protein
MPEQEGNKLRAIYHTQLDKCRKIRTYLQYATTAFCLYQSQLVTELYFPVSPLKVKAI